MSQLTVNVYEEAVDAEGECDCLLPDSPNQLSKPLDAPASSWSSSASSAYSALASHPLLHSTKGKDGSAAMWQVGRVVSLLTGLLTLAVTLYLLVVHRAPSSSLFPVTGTDAGAAYGDTFTRGDSHRHSSGLWLSLSLPPLVSSLHSSPLLSLNSSSVGPLAGHLCIDELPGRWGNHVYIIMMAIMYAQRHSLQLHLPPFDTQPVLQHADLFTSPCPTQLANVSVKQDGEWWLVDPRTHSTQQLNSTDQQEQQPSTPFVAHLQGYFQVSSSSYTHTPPYTLSRSDCPECRPPRWRSHHNRSWSATECSIHCAMLCDCCAFSTTVRCTPRRCDC